MIGGKFKMEIRDLKDFKRDETPDGFLSSIRTRLKQAKVPFIVASTVATMGLYGLVDQNIAYMPNNVQGIVEAAKGPSFEEIREYGLRERQLINRLTEIREQVLSETGDGWREKILDAFDQAISEANKIGDKFGVKGIEQCKQRIIGFNEKERIDFYKTHEYKFNTIHEYPMNYVTLAQGQKWACVAPGLYFSIVDPKIEKQSKMFSVKIPKLDDNIMTIRIAVKFGNRGIGLENCPSNLATYENAVQYVYKFFEGEISKEQFDEAAEEVVAMGYDDRTVLDIYSELKDTSLTNEEKNAIYTRAMIAKENPKAQIKREFNGKTYTFKYDNFDAGYIIVEFARD